MSQFYVSGSQSLSCTAGIAIDPAGGAFAVVVANNGLERVPLAPAVTPTPTQAPSLSPTQVASPTQTLSVAASPSQSRTSSQMPTPSQSVSPISPSQSLTVGVTPSQTPSAPLASLPQAAWNYDGSSNSLTSYTVVNRAGVSFVPDHCGVAGAATSLSGNTYMTYTGSTSDISSGSAPASMTAWVKCTNAGSFAVAYGTASNNELYGLYMSGTTAYMHWFSGNCNPNPVRNVCDGSWHHIAISYVPGTVSLYFDSVLANACGGITLNMEKSPGVFVGYSGDLAWVGGNLNAAITSARIYSSALSGPQVLLDLDAECLVVPANGFIKMLLYGTSFANSGGPLEIAMDAKGTFVIVVSCCRV